MPTARKATVCGVFSLGDGIAPLWGLLHSLPNYKFKLTMAFQKALDDNEAAVTLHYAHSPAPGAHPPAPH